MTHAKQILSLMLVAAASLFTIACGQQSNCNSSGFGSSAGAGSGTSGGVSSGSTNCSSSGNSSGNPGGTTSIVDFMYILSYDSAMTTNTLQAATLSSNGTFANISSFNGPSFPFDSTQNMVIVNKQFLYIPQPNLNQIQAFSINRTTGALTAIPGSPFPTSGGSTAASDPLGHFLFVGSTSTGLISVFQINSSTGALTQNSNSPFSTSLAFAYFVSVDGTGTYLYVSQHDPTLPTGVFSIDPSTGNLLSVGLFPLNVSGGSIASPTGASTQYYIGGSGVSSDNNLYVFAIDPSSGIPSAVSGSPYPTGGTPNFLAVHPSGQFFYVSEVTGSSSGTTSGPFEAFQLNATNGALTAVSGSPFSAFAPLEECEFDQSGANAFCLSGTGYSVLSVNSSTGVPTSTIPQLQASPFVFAVTN